VTKTVIRHTATAFTTNTTMRAKRKTPRGRMTGGGCSRPADEATPPTALDITVSFFFAVMMCIG